MHLMLTFQINLCDVTFSNSFSFLKSQYYTVSEVKKSNMTNTKNYINFIKFGIYYFHKIY